ncbi:4641_t:CDS:1, partial [Dentiscutata heterogama]
DVCDKCTLLKRALNENVNYINKDLDEKLANYISDYRKMREIYKDDVKTAKDCDQSLFRVFLFNFAQNVELPHNPQQPGR